jgi:outer membrane protein
MNKKRILFLWLLCAIPFTATRASGQNPSPASAGTREQSENTWSIGGGFIISPRPYRDTDPKFFPVPVVTGRYKRFFFQGIRGGVDLIQKGSFTTSAFAQARFRGLEPEDSDFLEGMSARRKSADAGLEMIYRGRPVGFRLGLISDILGRSKGQEASFLITSGIPLGKKGIILGGIGPRWLSSNRVDYYYGVRPEEVRPNRPAYSGTSTWNLDINVTLLLKLGERWDFTVLFNREGFGSNITASPLIEQTAGYSMVSSLTYRIK